MHVRKAIHAYKAIAGRTARYQRSSPLACVCRGLHRSLAHHNQETTSRNTTHFGYQTVYEDEKETKGTIFDMVVRHCFSSFFYSTLLSAVII